MNETRVYRTEITDCGVLMVSKVGVPVDFKWCVADATEIFSQCIVFVDVSYQIVVVSLQSSDAGSIIRLF